MYKHILAVLFILGSISLMGQNKVLDVYGKAGDQVKIRLEPLDYGTLETLFSGGFSVKRYTITKAGQDLSTSEVAQSVQLVNAGLMPLTEAQWDATFGSEDSIAMAAKSIIYDDELSLSFQLKNIDDIVKYNRVKKMRVAFSSLIAARDFSVAEAMGLGLTDSNIDTGDIYQYDIMQDTTLIQSIVINTAEDPYSPLEPSMDESKDRQVIITWQKEYEYLYYNIYRSVNQEPLALQNDVPYLYSTSHEGLDNTIYYRDSLVNNDDVYTYVIRGIDRFGEEGPPSTPMTASGTPPPLDIKLHLMTESIDENSVKVKWNDIPSSMHASIQELKMYRSSKLDGEYQEFANITDYSNTLIMDDHPYPTTFYAMAMKDIHGREYASNVLMAQLTDTLPPSPPTNLAISVAQDTISLSWTSGNEPDLRGFKVFRSNDRNSQFADISKHYFIENSYDDVIDMNNLTDSIFYVVKAMDNRGNESEGSEVIGIARPNSIPPAQPIIFSIRPKPNGNYVSWELGTDNALAYNVLMRKPVLSPKWIEVVKIMANDSTAFPTQGSGIDAYNFIDSTATEPIEYAYRLLAVDQQGNTSSSKVITVKSNFSFIEGDFKDIFVFKDCSGTVDINTSIGTTVIPFVDNQGTNNIRDLAPMVAAGHLSLKQVQRIHDMMSQGKSLKESLAALDTKNRAVDEKCTYYLDIIFNSEHFVKAIELYVGLNHEPISFKALFTKDSIKYIDRNHFRIPLLGVTQKIKYAEVQVLMNMTDNYTSNISEILIIDNNEN